MNTPEKIGLLAHFAKNGNYKREFTTAYVAKLLLFITDESYRNMVREGHDISFDDAIKRVEHIPKDMVACKLIYGEGRDEEHFADLSACIDFFGIARGNFEEIEFPNTPNVYLDLKSGKVYEYREEVEDIVDKIDKESLGCSGNSIYLSLNEGNLEIFPLLESFHDTKHLLSEIENLIKDSLKEGYIKFKTKVIMKCQEYISQAHNEHYLLHFALIDSFLYWLNEFIQKNQQPESYHTIKQVISDLSKALYRLEPEIEKLLEKKQRENIRLSYVEIDEKIKNIKNNVETLLMLSSINSEALVFFKNLNPLILHNLCQENDELICRQNPLPSPRRLSETIREDAASTSGAYLDSVGFKQPDYYH